MMQFQNSLQKYLGMEQAEQQGLSQPVPQETMTPVEMPPQRRDPIQEGANAGLMAARESMELSDKQRTRALGHAMMQFAAQMAQPPQEGWGEGFGGRMNAITQSMAPAAQVYAQQAHREQQHNDEIANKMAIQQQYAQKYQMQAQKDAIHQALEKDKFLETQRYHTGQLSRAPSRQNSDPVLQREKHLRLVNKDWLAVKAKRQSMIIERMKEVPVYGSKRAAMVKQVEAEVDAELAPILENIQERLKYEGSEYPTNKREPTVTYKKPKKKLGMDAPLEIPAGSMVTPEAPQMSDEEYERLKAVEHLLPD